MWLFAAKYKQKLLHGLQRTRVREKLYSLELAEAVQ